MSLSFVAARPCYAPCCGGCSGPRFAMSLITNHVLVEVYILKNQKPPGASVASRGHNKQKKLQQSWLVTRAPRSLSWSSSISCTKHLRAPLSRSTQTPTRAGGTVSTSTPTPMALSPAEAASCPSLSLLRIALPRYVVFHASWEYVICVCVCHVQPSQWLLLVGGPELHRESQVSGCVERPAGASGA